MNEGRKQVEEEIRLLEMLKELVDNKLKSKFAERELMQKFYQELSKKTPTSLGGR